MVKLVGFQACSPAGVQKPLPSVRFLINLASKKELQTLLYMLLSTLCSNKAFYLLVFLYCAALSFLPFLGAAALTISTILFYIVHLNMLFNSPLSDCICHLFFIYFSSPSLLPYSQTLFLLRMLFAPRRS